MLKKERARVDQVSSFIDAPKMERRTLVEWCRVGCTCDSRSRPWIRNDNLICGIVMRSEWEIAALPEKPTITLLFTVNLKLNHILQSRVNINLDKILSPLKRVCMELLRVCGAFERLPAK